MEHEGNVSPSNLVICFDGTWNEPFEGDASNIFKLYSLVKNNADGKRQIAYYDSGIGVSKARLKSEKVLGGILGLGIDATIKDAYLFLINNYVKGDKIYIFGFSRGAYSARSLIGFINTVGLLKCEHTLQVDNAYNVYRIEDKHQRKNTAKQFQKDYAHTPPSIEFLGVFDTVGALGGVPTNALSWINKPYLFHDTKLPDIVKSARHALSIDERRNEFMVTPWRERPTEGFEKENDDPRSIQMWFSGCHSDVGGGVGNPGLSDYPLEWMYKEATKKGLFMYNLSSLKHPDLPSKAIYTGGDPEAAIKDFYGIFNKMTTGSQRRIPCDYRAYDSSYNLFIHKNNTNTHVTNSNNKENQIDIYRKETNEWFAEIRHKNASKPEHLNLSLEAEDYPFLNTLLNELSENFESKQEKLEVDDDLKKNLSKTIMGSCKYTHSHNWLTNRWPLSYYRGFKSSTIEWYKNKRGIPQLMACHCADMQIHDSVYLKLTKDKNYKPVNFPEAVQIYMKKQEKGRDIRFPKIANTNKRLLGGLFLSGLFTLLSTKNNEKSPTYLPKTTVSLKSKISGILANTTLLDKQENFDNQSNINKGKPFFPPTRTPR